MKRIILRIADPERKKHLGQLKQGDKVFTDTAAIFRFWVAVRLDDCIDVDFWVLPYTLRESFVDEGGSEICVRVAKGLSHFSRSDAAPDNR